MSIRVRAVDHRQPAVAESIRMLQRAAFIQEADLLGIGPPPACHRTVAEVQALDEQFLLATRECDDEEAVVVGAVSWARLAPGVAIQRIWSLVVDPRCQRRGVARALLSATVRAQPGTTWHVYCARLNHRAMALYRHGGFAESTCFTLTPQDLEIVDLVRPSDIAHEPVSA